MSSPVYIFTDVWYNIPVNESIKKWREAKLRFVFLKEKERTMTQELLTVTRTLSARERTAAIIWLVIGIAQCCTFVFSISGIWNIYAAITRFRQAKRVLRPWRGLVNSYDGWITNIIICIVINCVFGGVVGILGAIYDLFAVRGYVLKNRAVFEALG